MNKIWAGKSDSAHEIRLSGLSSCYKTIGDTFVYEYTRMASGDVHFHTVYDQARLPVANPLSERLAVFDFYF